MVDVIPATTFAAELRTARIARDRPEAEDKGGRGRAGIRASAAPARAGRNCRTHFAAGRRHKAGSCL